MAAAGSGRHRRHVGPTTTTTRSRAFQSHESMDSLPQEPWADEEAEVIGRSSRRHKHPTSKWNGGGHLQTSSSRQRAAEKKRRDDDSATLIDHTRKRCDDDDLSTSDDEELQVLRVHQQSHPPHKQTHSHTKHSHHPAVGGHQHHISEQVSLTSHDDNNSGGDHTAPDILKERNPWWCICCLQFKIPLWWMGTFGLALWIILMFYLSGSVETPQAEAYQWYRGHPQFASLENPKHSERKKQVFALATLCYSMEYNDWTPDEQGYWLSYDVNECYWWNQTNNISMCNDNNNASMVTWIQFQNNANIVNGSVPNEMQLLSDLAILELNNMSAYHHPLTELLPFPDLEEDPEATSPLQHLQGLFVTNNALLAGVVPNFTQLAPNMTHLDLHNNALTGNLQAADLGLLTLLQYLDLSDNALTGTLPTELGLLTHLTHLDLHGNHQLEGTIPRELGQALTSLHYLDLSLNSLYGTIVTDMGRFSQIHTIKLFENNFRGQLPSELGLLTTLTALEVYGNYITGPIPDELCPRDNLVIVTECQLGHRCPCMEMELDAFGGCDTNFSNCTSECSCHEGSMHHIHW
ncbi:LRR receptor-like serine threonine-protein kinase [Seminavis robusta]|uniref:LRR receptor-like serine threonine-protein kinase n=1 Tax=Seminavis robusta TaxID=568900 RepID=A0A9N8EJ70_9STRA|nr:LRR receptor-like serine threonine-protein kinase [Seminavis robusta]|eukprot:Sro1166_g248280.1 LRR receptor-like serine threonine-protein kinase (577) ;mRNA; f:30941-32671